MRILFFGIYTKRDVTAVMFKGLQKNGVEILECCVPAEDFIDNIEKGKIRAAKRIRFLAVLWFLLRLVFVIYPKLWWKQRKLDYDILLVPHPSLAVMALARHIGRKRKKPVVNCVFVLVHETLCDDRKTLNPNSLLAKWLAAFENHQIKNSNLVLVETETDKQDIHKKRGMPLEKMFVSYVGADDEIFFPKNVPTGSELNVLFYASNIPLQGCEVAVGAREILANHPEIKFRLIGPFRGSNADWVAYDRLASEINRADIVLGIFGSTRKTEKYICNKVMQASACAKPTISFDTPAMREAFVHGESAYLLVSNTPKALANAILEMRDAGLRKKIAEGGHKVYKERFTPEKIGAELKKGLLGLSSLLDKNP